MNYPTYMNVRRKIRLILCNSNVKCLNLPKKMTDYLIYAYVAIWLFIEYILDYM